MKPGRTREDVRQEWKTTLSNFPLGAPKKNRRGGNPYLDQVKEIDKEIARGVVEDSDRLEEIIEEIDNTSGTGEFTQTEVNKEEVETEPVG